MTSNPTRLNDCLPPPMWSGMAAPPATYLIRRFGWFGYEYYYGSEFGLFGYHNRFTRDLDVVCEFDSIAEAERWCERRGMDIGYVVVVWDKSTGKIHSCP